MAPSQELRDKYGSMSERSLLPGFVQEFLTQVESLSFLIACSDYDQKWFRLATDPFAGSPLDFEQPGYIFFADGPGITFSEEARLKIFVDGGRPASVEELLEDESVLLSVEMKNEILFHLDLFQPRGA